MKPRAFVVMPFGDSVPVGDEKGEKKDPRELVDFSKVYKHLLHPALKRAGCLPFRADEETAAGDIRTDMFFELTTADFVVAEISAFNPNVYYELGVRNGVCPRGVFLVRGDWTWSRPFDIAPDRHFTYKGDCFIKGVDTKVPEAEIEQLAKVLRQAMRADVRTIGSPVYSHLPGLGPVDISGIQISKTLYFTALQDDWMERVRIAQSKGQPGHIMTLAEDAPTPVHRVKILFEAGKALIGLCRYEAAQSVLRDVLSLDPDHVDARVQLGLVLQHLGLTIQAEDEMRDVLRKHSDNPDATDILGQVYRHLWRLSWKKDSGVPGMDNLTAARENHSLAILAFQKFWQAQQTHPEAYFSGFNAVILLAMIDHLFKLQRPVGFGSEQVRDLIPVVRFSAECARRRATACGDHDAHFWTTTSLAGIALLESGDSVECPPHAMQLIRDACAFPHTTLFQLESFIQRLELLRELDFKRPFADEAIRFVRSVVEQKRSGCECRKVVLFHGCGIDEEGENDACLASSAISALEEAIAKHLEDWDVGLEDLAITGGFREPDLIFAQKCRERGAKVQILALDPTARELSGAMWVCGQKDWADEFRKLASDPLVTILTDRKELGSSLNAKHARGRHNRWVMNTARLSAEGTSSPNFLGIVLWNGERAPEDCDDEEHPAFFVAGIRRSLNYRGHVEVIRPADLSRSRAAVGG